MQAQILDLLQELQQEFGSAIIFITHDLGVVAEIADDVLVMYAGRAWSTARSTRSLGPPAHPYTWGLLSSMPRLAPPIDGRCTPSPARRPACSPCPPGCPFHPRCAYADAVRRPLPPRDAPTAPRPRPAPASLSPAAKRTASSRATILPRLP